MNPGAMTYGNQFEEVEVTLQEKLAEIDATIEDLHEKVRFGEAMKRLEANADYQMVINSGYLEAESERLTGLLVGEDPLRRESVENIVEATLAIRNLKMFLKFKRLDAMQAPAQIEENLQYRQHVTSSYAEDGSLIESTVE